MLQAIILGLVQGLTEFLPVSSSGHLVVVPYLLSWEQPSLAFDVALHGGTLVAVLAYFAGDLWFLATRMFGIGAEDPAEITRARKTVMLLAIASVPAALAGLLFETALEGVFGEPRLVALFLLVTAGILVLAERIRRSRLRTAVGPDGEPIAGIPADSGRDESTVGWVDALAIGGVQAFAILPGISRSGSTIAVGMLRGLSREGAARFSFLLAIPIILGATVLKVKDLAGVGGDGMFTGTEVLAGVAVAAISGYWAIRYLLRLVVRDDLTGFARYVTLFAVVTFIGSLWLGPPSSL